MQFLWNIRSQKSNSHSYLVVAFTGTWKARKKKTPNPKILYKKYITYNEIVYPKSMMKVNNLENDSLIVATKIQRVSTCYNLQ